MQMDARSENVLYSQIEEFTRQFICFSDDGIFIEIRDFFTLAENIKAFTVVFDKQSQHYKVAVKLAEFSRMNVNKVFSRFASFISYEGATISVRKPIEHGYHYLFVSLVEDGTGFCCEIDFTP